MLRAPGPSPSDHGGPDVIEMQLEPWPDRMPYVCLIYAGHEGPGGVPAVRLQGVPGRARRHLVQALPRPHGQLPAGLPPAQERRRPQGLRAGQVTPTGL